MKSWGANSLRIPLLASIFQPREGQPNNPPYNYSENGFDLLDRLVKWCKKYDIGIIWDMHGAPGGQNAENISDSDGEARLWTEKGKYWPMCIELWYKIAERYRNEKYIIGYDLLNEPLLIRYNNISSKLLRKLYIQLTDTIRTVDSEGIIFIEGDDWAQTFDVLEPMNWDKHLSMAFQMSLKDSDKNVRVASALALGQIRTERAVNELLSDIPSENDTNVVARILEALGKCGSLKCLDSLLNISEQEPMKFPPKEFAMCIARFAIRQIRTERSIWKCFEYTSSKSTDECSVALLALWRSAPNGLIDLEISKHKEELISLANNYCSDIRMHLATLLGRSKTKESREILDTLEKKEAELNNWRVWVQIVRARAAISSTTNEMLLKYSGYLSAKNNHIKIATLQAFSASPSPFVEQSYLVDSIKSTLCGIAKDTTEKEVVRGEALVALGKHFPKELESFHNWTVGSQVTSRFKAKYL
jgi:hypothetical protein